MTKINDLLDKKIMKLNDHIADNGKFIAKVAEGIIDEDTTVTFGDSSEVINDPIGKANEIVNTAQEIKELTIQCKALCDLEDDLFDGNKKVITGVKFGD